MAREYGIRDLRNHTSEVVSAVVESGDTVYLTSHRRRVAMISPIPASPEAELSRFLSWIDELPAYDSGLAEVVATQRATDALDERGPWG